MDNSSVLAYEMPDNRGEFVLQRDPLVEKVDAEANNGPEFDLRARMINTLFSIQYGSEEALEKFNKLSEEAHEAEMENVLEDSILLFAARKGLGGLPDDFKDFVIEISDIPVDKLEEKCRLGRGDESEYYYKRQNTEIMATLEYLEPGSTKVLAEEFGIYNFSRYPTNILLEQYRERDNKDIGFGITSIATADYSGGFDSEISKNNIQSLYSILKSEGKTLRIYESQDIKEASRALFYARHKYGKKIGDSFLSAHGNEEAIVFDEYYNAGGYISKNEVNRLRQSTAARYSGMFEDDAMIILNSCKTGAPGAVGQSLANLLGVNILAPDQNSFLKSVQKIRGKIVADFDGANTRAISPTRALT